MGASETAEGLYIWKCKSENAEEKSLVNVKGYVKVKELGCTKKKVYWS